MEKGESMKLLSNEVAPEVRFELALERVQSHLNQPKIKGRQLAHLRQWTVALGHAVYHMHPELREDGSFLRYFVVKAGRRQGLRGMALTEFVDKAFREGIPAEYFPQWFVRGEFKKPWELGTCAAAVRKGE